MGRLRRILRSRTFTTHRNGVRQPGLRRGWRFLKGRPRTSNAWAESYGVGKRRRISRMAIYWYQKRRR